MRIPLHLKVVENAKCKGGVGGEGVGEVRVWGWGGGVWGWGGRGLGLGVGVGVCGVGRLGGSSGVWGCRGTEILGICLI